MPPNIKVYALKAYGMFGCGMAIVAAYTEDEAKGLAEDIDSFWHVQYITPEEVIELPVVFEGRPQVIEHYEFGS